MMFLFFNAVSFTLDLRRKAPSQKVQHFFLYFSLVDKDVFLRKVKWIFVIVLVSVEVFVLKLSNGYRFCVVAVLLVNHED